MFDMKMLNRNRKRIDKNNLGDVICLRPCCRHNSKGGKRKLPRVSDCSNVFECEYRIRVDDGDTFLIVLRSEVCWWLDDLLPKSPTMSAFNKWMRENAGVGRVGAKRLCEYVLKLEESGTRRFVKCRGIKAKGWIVGLSDAGLRYTEVASSIQ